MAKYFSFFLQAVGSKNCLKKFNITKLEASVHELKLKSKTNADLHTQNITHKPTT